MFQAVFHLLAVILVPHDFDQSLEIPVAPVQSVEIPTHQLWERIRFTFSSKGALSSLKSMRMLLLPLFIFFKPEKLDRWMVNVKLELR